jgi:DNA polymerase-3 subunit delta'
MFNDIIGNDENKKKLEYIVKNNNISHSYIFSGISGIGKFMFAKEFAKAILCLDNEKKPCNNCRACKSFENNNNPDIIIIDEQDESIKTEQIKELVKNVLEKPIQGEKKIYIINNSENMTREAQNSLLKTLEEPPEYVIVILITSNENLLLNTIKSRCIKFQFQNLSDEEIKQYFRMANQVIDDSIIKIFGGSIEKALKLKDNLDTYKNIKNIFKNIENLSGLQILNLKETIFKDKDEIFSILDYINTIFFDKILENIKTANKYQKCIEIIEESKLRLKRNSNYDMTIDNLLLTLERSLKKNG